MGIRRARAAIVVAAFMACTLLTTTLAAAGTAGQPAGHTGGNRRCHAGASGVGDDYYPLYGNGGYDVAHYLLKVSYNPATDRLVGVATIFARATENLCSFNLDFQGMTVRSVVVDGKRAAWSRSQDHELTVTPGHALKKGRRFTTVVRYDGVPRTQQIIIGPDFSIEAGFMRTDDGAVIAGEPEVAANWFPVNDHPIDKASYTFVVTVPAGLEVVGNGRLVAHTTHGRSTTWIWNAPEPMASYLATATMGQFDLHTYRTASGLRMYDAIDPDLFKEQVDPDDPASPTFGEIAEGSLARQGEILDFLSQQFGTPTRSPPAAGSSTTTTTCSSPSRIRRGRSTPSSSSPIRSAATRWWSTRTRTSGSATAWRWPSGSTSGSTRASPPTPSGSGASTRIWGPPRRFSTPSTTGSGGQPALAVGHR